MTKPLLRVLAPCSESFDEMDGNDLVRHCTECDLDVIDTTRLSRAELDRLLQARQEGRLCARVANLEDGTPLTRDHPRAPTSLRRSAAAASVALAAFLGCADVPTTEPQQDPATNPQPPLAQGETLSEKELLMLQLLGSLSYVE